MRHHDAAYFRKNAQHCRTPRATIPRIRGLIQTRMISKLPSTSEAVSARERGDVKFTLRPSQWLCRGSGSAPCRLSDARDVSPVVETSHARSGRQVAGPSSGPQGRQKVGSGLESLTHSSPNRSPIRLAKRKAHLTLPKVSVGSRAAFRQSEVFKVPLQPARRR